MPQLVKGGKYIFGWSKIRNNGHVKIPSEAFQEYQIFNDKNLILISGSKSSGGFGLSSARLMKDSALASIFDEFPLLKTFQCAEGKMFQMGGRFFCWLKLLGNEVFRLNKNLLDFFALEVGYNLLIGRGSGYALGFLTKGLIYQEALKHNDIPQF